MDRLRRVDLVKSLKMSQTFDSRLLNFKECSLSLVLPLSALQSVGGPVSDIHNRYISMSYRAPFLQATGFLVCPTPGFPPCGEKTGGGCAAFRLAFIIPPYPSLKKKKPLSQVYDSWRILNVRSAP